MSERNYSISSPLLFSLFPKDFLEYNNEKSNSNEFFEQNTSEYEAFSLKELYNILDDNTTDSEKDITDSEDFQNDI
ncbi:7192_t:CDS:1, partial [Funneliformis geosporum]